MNNLPLIAFMLMTGGAVDSGWWMVDGGDRKCPLLNDTTRKGYSYVGNTVTRVIKPFKMQFIRTIMSYPS